MPRLIKRRVRKLSERDLVNQDPGELQPFIRPNFSEIEDRLKAVGMRIEARLLRRYHSALLSRGFVILAGLSGSGKTWLAEAYASAIGAQHWLCAVSPSWNSNEDLLGYYNPFTESFQSTSFTNFLGEANAAWERASGRGIDAQEFHVVLDEMNLARTEYYFASFLSAMEVRARSPLGEALLAEYPKCTIKLPPNLRVIGTINVDETTHGFSDKVYDRAQLIEVTVSRELILEHLGAAEYAPEVLAVWDAVESVAPFAFRTLDDMAAYIEAAAAAGSTWQDALDDQIVQKVLPKVRGSDPRVGDALEALERACGSMPISKARARKMLERFRVHGFTSFF